MMKKTIRIDRRRLWLYILFTFMFEPKLFVKNNITNTIFVLGAVLCFSIILIKYILSRHKINKMFFVCILYRLSFAIQTVISHGDILMWGYMSLIIICLLMTIELYADICPDKLLTSLVDVLISILTVNLLISFIYPDGVIDGIYYIGIRTRFTEVIFAAVGLSITLDIMHNQTISTRTLICILLSIAHIIRFWIATAIIGGLVFIFCLTLLMKVNKLVKFLQVKYFLLFSLIGTVIITMSKDINLFTWFIEDVLNKSLTLSSRTLLWSNTRRIIMESPVIGHGQAINGNFVPAYYIGGYDLKQSHNQWLQTMYDGGLLTSGLFALIIYNEGKAINRCISSSKIGRPICAATIAMLIMMLAEIYSYTPYLFAILFAGYKTEKMECRQPLRNQNTARYRIRTTQ